ncbi:CehA/McbA family metallohydrolase [Micromonospora sp. WMMD812]|uniref:CehA/McbA family metallohydrolase n=1 Tax=Micromonospora sp. WMMD812 TaxID=3015152 RepID=UPI00248B06F8|nr:CehA/McbA family metallohydrolase [Micromonospora sp. WMMD812]WBB70034.1 CehA/McbA family metallohydrolase [Micromonospora sp. WMMD812]
MELDRRRFIAIGGAVAAAGLLPGTAAQADAGDEREHGGHGEPEGMWLPGDTHVHDDHSSDGSAPRQLSDQRDPGNLPVSDQISYAESVGLAFLPLTDHRTFDQHWDPLWRSDKLLLLTGEEVNGSPHAVVLGAVDTVVDGANPPGSAAFRHVQQSIWDAHAQNAFWSVAHPDDGEYTSATGPNDNASAQGVDAVELWNASSNPDVEIEYAENRWNHGFRFGGVAASDSHFKELRPASAPGRPTTWVFAAERSVRAILDALKAGRTTLSLGPDGPFATIEADVDGDGRFEAIGGDEVIVGDRRLPKRATLRVRVKAAAGMRVLVYAAPGRSAGPVATYVPAADDQTYLLPLTLSGDHTWYRVEVRAPGELSGREADPNLPDQLRAATSPVFVSVKRPAVPAPEIALPAPAGAADRADLVLGERSGFAGFADVAVEGRITHVVAEVHEGHRTAVVYRRLDGHGDRHADKGETLSGQSGTARAPRVVASGDDVWVVWQDARGQERPHRPGIWLRHSGNGGRSFAPAVKLSTGHGRAEQPALAVLDGRHPVVAWAENSGGAFDVHVQVVGVDRAPVNVSAAGKVIVPGTPEDARSPIHPASLFPAVAVTRAGRIVVTWQDNRFDPDAGWTGHTPPAGQPAGGGTNPDNWEILAAVRPGSGRRWGSPVRVSANDDAADRHPAVAVDRDGAYVVVWETKALSAAGVNLTLRASRSTDGVTWSAAEAVALDPNAMSQRPRVAADPDGAIRVVWYDSRSADWRWKVLTSRRTASGWTPPLPAGTLGNNTWPAVDNGVVVFTSDRRAERSQRDGTQEIYLVRQH